MFLEVRLTLLTFCDTEPANVRRLSDNNRARQALRQCLPEPLRDATFSNVLRDDAATKRCLAQLLINLSDPVGGEAEAGFD
jgi:CCR4-NOT transcription complex subunit 9